MAQRLDGKIALITGGTSGIGEASALAFAREGAKVAVCGRGAEAGEKTLARVRDAGGEGIFVRADVTRADDVEKLVERVVAEWGRLDCALNNAGSEVTPWVFTVDFDEAEWDRVVSVNLKGTFLAMKYEIRQMLRQERGGSIVNTASWAGLVGLEGFPAYVASKHGVVGLTKTAALENAKKNIRVNALCPGVVYTPMVGDQPPEVQAKVKEILGMEDPSAIQPMGRMGLPEEIAEAAVWLASDVCGITTGTALPLDGGYTAR